MRPHDALGMIFILIFVFLLINKSDGTTKVVTSLGKAANDTIQTLQGRDNGITVPGLQQS